jgi:hypothetical protein
LILDGRLKNELWKEIGEIEEIREIREREREIGEN